MEELGTHSAIERAEMVTLLLRCCAPSFYPDVFKSKKLVARKMALGMGAPREKRGYRLVSPVYCFHLMVMVGLILEMKISN